jgi:hypothetical protein
MKALVDRRRRIVRVRRVQHLQASAEAARAEGKVASLETSAERLVELRMSLGLAPGTVNGAALSNVGELAMRLDTVRDGLTVAIVSARASAEQFAALRLEARIRQESAEKLGEQAQAALVEERERRVPGGSRRRLRIGEEA